MSVVVDKPAERTPCERRHSRLIAFAILTAALLAIGGSGVGRAAQEIEGVKVLGVLPQPPRVGESDRKLQFIVGTDQKTQTLYLLFNRLDALEGWFLGEYDLRPSMPRLVREYPIPGLSQVGQNFFASPYYAAIGGHPRRLFISRFGDVANVLALNLEDGSSQVWNLNESLPGFDAEGLTYSEKDDRVYFVGEMPAPHPVFENHGTLGGDHTPLVTAVLAMEPVPGKPSAPWQRAWAYPLVSCQQPLNLKDVGAFITRSTRRDAIYTVCVQSSTHRRPSGVARINLPAGGGEEQGDIQNFRVDFFPVSGMYTGGGGLKGTAAFDHTADRLFLSSLALNTPGTWVFDGRLDAWVGFIAARDKAVLPWSAVNERTGHFYAIAEAAPSFLVTDGRGMPPPQGSFYQVRSHNFYIVADASNRVFVRTTPSSVGLAPNPGADTVEVPVWIALEDQTNSEPPLAPTDYDAYTSEVPPGQAVDVTYAGAVSGYGSRIWAVGGLGALYNIFTNGLPQALDVANLGPGDRGFYASRVASLDLRNTGSSASAQALATDSGTEDEHHTRQSQLRSTCGAAADTKGAPLSPEQRAQIKKDGCAHAISAPTPEVGATSLDQIFGMTAEAATIPWNPVTCLDGEGQDNRPAPEEDSQHLGRAEVLCSLSTEISSAKTSFEARAPLIDGLRVARSDFEANVSRNSSKGVVATATALAEGVVLDAGSAKVSIGRVLSRATTSAAGQPKTAVATWERTLSDVVIESPQGTQRYDRCTGPKDCRAQLDAINTALTGVARVEMPEGNQLPTPRGAFAGISKSESEYLNGLTVNNDDTRAAPALVITYYGDGAYKQRVLVQLAAIEATSIYTISVPGADMAPIPTNVLGTMFTGSPAPAIGPGTPSVAPVGPGPALSPLMAVKGVVSFLLRSPMQALQFAAILLLILTSVSSFTRRRFRLGT